MSLSALRQNLNTLIYDEPTRRPGQKAHVSMAAAQKILDQASVGKNIDQDEWRELTQVHYALQSGAFTADPGVKEKFAAVANKGPDRTLLEKIGWFTDGAFNRWTSGKKDD